MAGYGPGFGGGGAAAHPGAMAAGYPVRGGRTAFDTGAAPTSVPTPAAPAPAADASAAAQLTEDELEGIFGEDEEYRRWLAACASDEDGADDPCGAGLDAADGDTAMDVANSPSGPRAPWARDANRTDTYSWEAFSLAPIDAYSCDGPGFPEGGGKRSRVMGMWGIAEKGATGAGWGVTAAAAGGTRDMKFVDVTAPAVPFGISRLPPSELVVWGERELTLELVRVLQGRPSKCVENNLPTREVRLARDVAVDGLSPAALRGMCATVLTAATRARRVARTLEALQKRCPTPFTANAPPAATAGGAGSTGVAGVAPLVPALSDTIRALLRACEAYWCEVEATWAPAPRVLSRPAPASLPRLRRVVLESGIADWLVQCEQVVACALSLEDDCYGATVFLSRLSRWAERQWHGGTDRSRGSCVAVSLLLRCLAPYLAEVSGWVGSGKLAATLTQEPMLFIADASRRNVGPYANWEDRWRVVAAKVPCFIPPDIARVVAVTGLSVRFLTALRSKLISEGTVGGGGVCAVPPVDLERTFNAEFFRFTNQTVQTAQPPRLNTAAAGLSDAAAERVRLMTVDLPPVHTGTQPCTHALRTALATSLQRYSDAVGGALVASMHDHCDMDRYLALLQGVFLLQKGAVMQYFCAKHLFPLARRSDWNGKPSSEEMKTLFLESWLVDKSTRREQLLFLEGVTVRWADIGEDVASLRFSPEDDTPRVPIDREPPPTPLRIVTGLIFEFLPKSSNSPMHIVFPQDVVQAYARVLQVLLLVAYAQHVLVQLRLPKMPWKASQLETQIIATRLHLLHFIQALKDHLLQKTQAIWAEGVTRLAAARDIEGIRSCHKHLAKLLLAAVNFSCRHREHWTTLLSIVTLTLHFEEAIRPYIDWMREVSLQFSVRGVRISDPAISRDSFPAPAHVHDKGRTLPSALRSIMSQFRRHMQFFVAALRSHGSTSTGNAVLARFDFSNIYSK